MTGAPVGVKYYFFAARYLAATAFQLTTFHHAAM
jgi:hypothetical protein